MKPLSRFLAGLSIVLAVIVYAELGLGLVEHAVSWIPWIGPFLAGPLALLLPWLFVPIAYTFSYVAIFGNLVPKASLAGKKIGLCKHCGYEWEMGKDDASRFWYKTKGDGEQLEADTKVSRICPRCGLRLGAWEPVADEKDVTLPERLRVPKKLPR